MCVIAAKPAGIDMPTDKEIETMWWKNPDGAGIMYAIDGKVQIEKGFMTLENFRQKIAELDKKLNLKSLSVVMHFRIATHGGTTPENTHPFPISDSIGMLKKRKLTTDLGVAHNGIIHVTPRKDISDTMEYIAGQLAPLKRAVPNFYRDKDLLKMIEHATDSKLAFLDGKGRIELVGEFIENNGIKYSNRSFENWGTWRDYNWEEYEDTTESTWTSHRTADFVLRKLMWLDEDRGEYVKNCMTNTYEFGEFAIDASGCLYEYNPQMDCFEEIYASNYQAYNGEGMPLKYNTKSNMISEELVIL